MYNVAMAEKLKAKETPVSAPVANPAEAQVAEIHTGCKAILEGLGIAVTGDPVRDFTAVVRALR